VEQTWNDWEQISVERQPSSKRWIHHVDNALQDACKLLAGRALLLRPCAGTRIALALTGVEENYGRTEIGLPGIDAIRTGRLDARSLSLEKPDEEKDEGRTARDGVSRSD